MRIKEDDVSYFYFLSIIAEAGIDIPRFLCRQRYWICNVVTPDKNVFYNKFIL